MTKNPISQRRKLAYVLGAAACTMLAVSCGGGNNEPTPTPTPTGTGTGTPTPTPTVTPTPLAFDSDFSSTSNAIYLYAYFTPNGGIEVFNDASRVNGSAGINYIADPQSVMFGLSVLQDSVGFDAADVVTSTPTLLTFAEGDESLFLELPFGNVLRASYERSNSFVRETVPGELRSRSVAIFRFPVQTTDPIASNLSYSGQPEVVGSEPGETLSDAVSAPQRTFTVTQSNSTLTGTIPVFEEDGGATVQTAALSFTATLAANGTFSGDVTDTTYDFEGKFAATLAGPDREEIVVIFSASQEDGRKYVGSFIGN